LRHHGRSLVGSVRRCVYVHAVFYCSLLIRFSAVPLVFAVPGGRSISRLSSEETTALWLRSSLSPFSQRRASRTIKAYRRLVPLVPKPHDLPPFFPRLADTRTSKSSPLYIQLKPIIHSDRRLPQSEDDVLICLSHPYTLGRHPRPSCSSLYISRAPQPIASPTSTTDFQCLGTVLLNYSSGVCVGLPCGLGPL
jgi:hypothetical protein